MNTTLLFYFMRNKGISRYSPKAGIQSFMIFNFLAKESKKVFGKGFDYSNVKNMRQFYLVFPIGDALHSQLRMFSAGFEIQSHYASADEPFLQAQSWIEEQWNTARLMAKKSRNMLLVLDEIQKIPLWSDIVKNLWDEDTRNRIPLKTVILGSSPLLMQRGLSESLAGRFEIIPVSHWSYSEMRDAFRWKLEQYIYFGGYPGAAPLIHDQQRWSRYIIDSLIETTISRDVLHMTRVDKPP